MLSSISYRASKNKKSKLDAAALEAIKASQLARLAEAAAFDARGDVSVTYVVSASAEVGVDRFEVGAYKTLAEAQRAVAKAKKTVVASAAPAAPEAEAPIMTLDVAPADMDADVDADTSDSGDDGDRSALVDAVEMVYIVRVPCGSAISVPRNASVPRAVEICRPWDEYYSSEVPRDAKVPGMWHYTLPTAQELADAAENKAVQTAAERAAEAAFDANCAEAYAAAAFVSADAAYAAFAATYDANRAICDERIAALAADAAAYAAAPEDVSATATATAAQVAH